MKTLFAATLFLSAFLLFLVEPIVARMILPVLGGAPMVWTGCVLFFQCVLLAGYAYWHGAAAWLRGPWRTVTYVALLIAPFAFLPFVTVPGSAPGDGNPLGWLLLVLTGSIGAPFFVLASSTSALQHVYAGTPGRGRGDPYFLYVASNAGSLLGLLTYPLVVEPVLTLRAQSRLWTVGYATFVVLALVCVAASRAGRTMIEPLASTPEPLTTRRRLSWVALAAVPASLMLGVTGYLTSDIASFPLLWIIPLAIYLLTFMLAFSQPERWRRIADRRLPIGIVVVSVFMLLNIGAPVALVVVVHLATFSLAAVLCHARLAGDRPPASQLTEFYLWIALGGVVGSLFNTLAAPLLFTSVAEYPIALVLAAFVRQGDRLDEPRAGLTSDALMAAAVGLLTLAFVVGINRFGGPAKAAFLVPALLCFSQLRRPKRFAMAVAAMLLASAALPFGTIYGQILMARRTFFGVYRVSRDPSGIYYSLYHGTTQHGLERIDGRPPHEPLTYYHRAGPFGQAFDRLPHASTTPRVAVVGRLGTGALASYAGRDQQWTFFEIDPVVEELARDTRYFSHLAACGSRCRVVVGDARLSLARSAPGEYGLIVLDAFSSDAIPVHLMTDEAIALYLSRLAPDGVLAFHISNNSLRLDAVLGRLAAAHGLTSLMMQDAHAVDVDERGMTSSTWMVMARQPADLGTLMSDPHWSPPGITMRTPLWTDDFSNLLSVFRLWS